MSNKPQTLPIKFAESVEFTVPEFDTRPSVHLNFSSIKEGEKRLIEAQLVNPATYSELEFCYNEGYREGRTNLSVIGYEVTQAERIVRKIRGEYILDEYPGFLKERGLKDNGANREAYLERQDDYVAAVERVAMLKALEHLLEGKVKVFENVCRYMKKQMDILIRSGINSNKY